MNSQNEPTFFELLSAGYSLLNVNTYEELRAIKTLSWQANNPPIDPDDPNVPPKFNFYTWNCVSGLVDVQTGKIIPMPGPMDPLTFMYEGKPPLDKQDSVLFLKDFHEFIKRPQVYRIIANLVPILQASNRHIVFVGPIMEFVPQLEKEIIIYDFKLPTESELLSLAEKIVKDNELEEKGIKIDTKAREAVKAGVGMTIGEFSDALSLSLVRKKKFDKEIIHEAKLQTVKKTELLEIFRPVNEEELGGLPDLKQYIKTRKKGFHDDKLPTPKGILLTGPSGAGKSLSAKVIASILEVPLIKITFAKLKSKYVGESQKRAAQARNIIDAIGQCVVWWDEVEKDVTGVQSSGKLDSGTTAGMFGETLTWMQESSSPKYIVATCNDIGELLTISQGAFLRSGRFDDIFFVDLPDEEGRKEILKIMNRRYGTKIPVNLVNRMTNWTGAEIEAFVKSSCYEGIEVAMANVHPIYEQNRIIIDAAREWASKNARYASSPRSITELAGGKVRKINI